MINLWMNGSENIAPNPRVRIDESSQIQSTASQMRELQHQVQRLMLLNQALWELLREKLNVTDAELEQKAAEIDLRDGVQDGRLTEVGMRCPSCNRVSNSKHWKCLYCGQEFERPIMGS
ncbi:MAG: hypothetical protein AMXMBFR84_21170 [Candidatus Hydrogenedentota bacterium]